MSTFTKRMVSGIILTLIAILVLMVGGHTLQIAITMISLIGVYELLRTIKLSKSYIGTVAYFFTIVYSVLLYTGKNEWMSALFIALILILLFLYVICYPKYRIEQISMIFFAFLYAGVLLSYIYQIRCMSEGNILVWLILISASGSDTFAYLIGMLIGKHKLPSELSPNKTIEGCFGGIIGAALLGFAFSFFYKESAIFWISPQIAFPIICAFGSVVSQIGDLAASAIKRNYSIKDFGNLIPGHGGIIDRFDSIIFAAPVVYYLLVILSELN